MNYYSTSHKNETVSLEEAVLRGLAPDGGLYMPESLAPMPAAFFNTLSDKSFTEIAVAVTTHLLKGDLPEDEINNIVRHTLQFDAPLVEVDPDVYALELFHGPTLAFKDFGARFLSGLLGYFARRQKKEIVILVATSGDTGSAVANGFYNVDGTRVVVLYPSGKVSPLQEKQFTTLGGNISALEIDGTFDDCQRLVKTAFLDPDLQGSRTLASANSINIGRLIPQMFYYFNAIARLPEKEVVFTVPSGNFGNLTAGLIARRLGLPVKHFVAATNVNDIVPEYLNSGKFTPRRSTETISNAMDVGNPSNFARLLDLYGQSFDALSRDVTGFRFTDEQTRHALVTLMRRDYLADPHGAVAWLGAMEYKEKFPGDYVSVFLETAHPGKFGEVVEKTLNISLTLPPRLHKFLAAEKHSETLSAEYRDFQAWIRKNC